MPLLSLPFYISSPVLMDFLHRQLRLSFLYAGIYLHRKAQGLPVNQVALHAGFLHGSSKVCALWDASCAHDACQVMLADWSALSCCI